MEEVKVEGASAKTDQGHPAYCCGDECDGNNCKHRNENAVWTIAGSVLLGSLIIGASILTISSKLGSSAPTAAAGAQNNNQPTAQAPSGPKQATVSIDNDPVLGDKAKAKVAIVEFSDYECPFCKQFHQTTYNDLLKEYVDTGKAIYVFRDFPLSFHEPNASKAANLAQCVREAKGDQAFYAFTLAYYANTQANGKGLPEGKLDEILKSLGVNVTSINQCATSEKFKDEIAKDMNDGAAAGVEGTPSFVIGKLDSRGNVTGELVVGALPTASFKTTVDKYLSQ